MIYDLQKASLTKRLSAFLFDFILLLIAFTGFMVVVSAIVGYDGYTNKQKEILSTTYDKYSIAAMEEKYDVSYVDYPYMTEEEKNAVPEEARNNFDSCREELSTNSELQWLNAMIVNLMLTIISISSLLAFLVMEFAIPLFLKNGQTLGKKIFSIAVMRTDGVMITPFVLFVRAILGKYTIGTMIPLLMVLLLMFGPSPLIPLTVLLLVLLLQIVFFVTSRTNSLIHDYLSSTVAVDFQSQMIFDSLEAKNAYILRIHSEDSEKKNVE